MSDSSERQPSEEGRRRHPETGGYYEDEPCVCVPACGPSCKGGRDCQAGGCPACGLGYSDFLSVECYQRIMRAAAGGHGLTLTPDEVATLSASEAIQQAAAKDNGEAWQ